MINWNCWHFLFFLKPIKRLLHLDLTNWHSCPTYEEGFPWLPIKRLIETHFPLFTQGYFKLYPKRFFTICLKISCYVQKVKLTIMSMKSICPMTQCSFDSSVSKFYPWPTGMPVPLAKNASPDDQLKHCPTNGKGLGPIETLVSRLLFKVINGRFQKDCWKSVSKFPVMSKSSICPTYKKGFWRNEALPLFRAIICNILKDSSQSVSKFSVMSKRSICPKRLLIQNTFIW